MKDSLTLSATGVVLAYEVKRYLEGFNDEQLRQVMEDDES